MTIRWKLAVTGVVLTGCVLCLPTAMRLMVATRLERQLGASVHIGRVQLSLDERVLGLNDVRIESAPSTAADHRPQSSVQFSVDKALIRFRMQDLLHRNLVLETIGGEGARWTLAVPHEHEIPWLDPDRCSLLSRSLPPTSTGAFASVLGPLQLRIRDEGNKLQAKYEQCAKELAAIDSILADRPKSIDRVNPLRDLDIAAKATKGLSSIKQQIAEYRLLRKENDKLITASKTDLQSQLQGWIHERVEQGMPSPEAISRFVLEQSAVHHFDSMRPHLMGIKLGIRAEALDPAERDARTEAHVTSVSWIDPKGWFAASSNHRGYDVPLVGVDSGGRTSIQRAVFKGIATVHRDDDPKNGLEYEFEAKWSANGATWMPGDSERALDVQFRNAGSTISSTAKWRSESPTTEALLQTSLICQASQRIFEMQVTEMKQGWNCNLRWSPDSVSTVVEQLLHGESIESEPFHRGLLRRIAVEPWSRGESEFEASVVRGPSNGLGPAVPSTELRIASGSIDRLAGKLREWLPEVARELERDSIGWDRSDVSRAASELDAHWAQVMQRTGKQLYEMETLYERASQTIVSMEVGDSGRVARRTR